jgi:hypothetical protein
MSRTLIREATTDEFQQHQKGLCYDPNSQPPTVSDGSEQFVLCCKGYSGRGNGQHCLRYDYSAAYRAFSVREMGFTGVVGVSVTSNQNTSTLRLTQKNYFEQKPSVTVPSSLPVVLPAWRRILLYNRSCAHRASCRGPPSTTTQCSHSSCYCSSPATPAGLTTGGMRPRSLALPKPLNPDRSASLKQSANLVSLLSLDRRLHLTQCDPCRNWFWSYKLSLPSNIGVSADTWKAQATCSQATNLNTRTHALAHSETYAQTVQRAWRFNANGPSRAAVTSLRS